MKKITLTADPVIITDDKKIILVKRVFDPYQDQWALPGGIVEYGETVEEAAIREAKEETGLDIKIEKLVGVYSAPDRDPRGHFVSVCFLCKPVGGEIKTSEETKEVKAFSKEEIKGIKLAFDHGKILRDIGFIE
ncbi:MAG TPA: NUDIX hydrolase [Thermodesulfobacteriota bacterium]|jgi:8-oxo-dGTP diphosphatase|nr:NUDIX hydrolase [Thermodesulfobacteriota bacterium]